MFFFLTAAPTRGWANRADQAGQFLANFGVIRIGVPEGEGNGHQAFSVMVAKRLREIGYLGKLQLIYSPGTERKLEFLLPPFAADGPTQQYIPSLDLSAMSLDAMPKKKVGLALVSAENFTPDQPKYRSRLELKINPPRWGRMPLLTLREKGRRDRMVELDVPHFTPAVVSAPAPVDIADFIRTQMSDRAPLRAKVGGLIDLFSIKDAFQLLSVYGIGYSGVNPLLTLVGALNRLQELSAQVARRPIVMGMISNFNRDEWDEFLFELNPVYRRNLEILTIESTNLREHILNAPANRIFLIKIGNVTQEVWNLLMDQSDLAPVVAGTTGINFLSQRGRPFLITTKTEALRFSLPKEMAGYDSSADIYRFMHIPDLLLIRATHVIAQFYLSSLNPDSVINRKFRRFAEALPKFGDRTCEAILKMQDVVVL